MSKNSAILILTIFISGAAFGAGMSGRNLLRDGFLLAGVDGKLTKENNRWLFKFDSDVSDDRGVVKAGAAVELLPSAALEKMTLDAEEHFNGEYRLWGKVTKYKNKNFIFPIYFLPLSKISERQLAQPQGPQKQAARITINEPNDALAIPREIIAKLATRQIARSVPLRKGLELKQDFILANRTGFVSPYVMRDANCVKKATQSILRSSTTKDEYEFVFDALGRNVQQMSMVLLPCRTLERTLQTQSDELEPMRFKIAGIVTKYKGRHYLLAERAIRVYSHGNFAR